MKSYVFNGGLLTGVALVGIGVGMLAGVGGGLIAVGVLLIALTLYVARNISTKAG